MVCGVSLRTVCPVPARADVAPATHPPRTGLARIYEGIGDHDAAIVHFKRLLVLDSTNAEAIASLATSHFYSSHPETALLLFRRLLQMGAGGAELFNNMALCCFHAQQYDMALPLFQRALRETTDDAVAADIWYNQATVALALGDVSLAYQVRADLACARVRAR